MKRTVALDTSSNPITLVHQTNASQNEKGGGQGGEQLIAAYVTNYQFKAYKRKPEHEKQKNKGRGETAGSEGKQRRGAEE